MGRSGGSLAGWKLRVDYVEVTKACPPNSRIRLKFWNLCGILFTFHGNIISLKVFNTFYDFLFPRDVKRIPREFQNFGIILEFGEQAFTETHFLSQMQFNSQFASQE